MVEQQNARIKQLMEVRPAAPEKPHETREAAPVTELPVEVKELQERLAEAEETVRRQRLLLESQNR